MADDDFFKVMKAKSSTESEFKQRYRIRKPVRIRDTEKDLEPNAEMYKDEDYESGKRLQKSKMLKDAKVLANHWLYIFLIITYRLCFDILYFNES